MRRVAYDLVRQPAGSRPLPPVLREPGGDMRPGGAAAMDVRWGVRATSASTGPIEHRGSPDELKR